MKMESLDKLFRPQWQAIKNVKSILSRKELRNIEGIYVTPPSTDVEIKFKNMEKKVKYNSQGDIINGEK